MGIPLFVIMVKDKEQMTENLIDLVLEQISKDIESGDLTAIEELLKAVPEENLKGYLSEEDQ